MASLVQAQMQRYEAAAKAGEEALSWAPDDPVTMCRVLPHIERFSPSPELKRDADRYLKAAIHLQVRYQAGDTVIRQARSPCTRRRPGRQSVRFGL
jgi:hypothetical protein